MFSGVGKTARELALAVDHGILCVNVQSDAELELLINNPQFSVSLSPTYEAMSRRPIRTNMLAKTGSKKRSEMRVAR